MTNIQINEEQKKKLLEMCTSLFPESNWHMSTENGTCGMHARDYNKFFIYQGSNPYNFPQSVIHWFEFCLTKLLDKLCDYGVMGLYNTTGYFGIEHPVDFLYEKFKKLKL